MSFERCPICMDNIRLPVGVTNSCRHAFCYSCLKEWSAIRNACPLDRTPFDEILLSDKVGGAITHGVNLIISLVLKIRRTVFVQVCSFFLQELASLSQVVASNSSALRDRQRRVRSLEGDNSNLWSMHPYVFVKQYEG